MTLARAEIACEVQTRFDVVADTDGTWRVEVTRTRLPRDRRGVRWAETETETTVALADLSPNLLANLASTIVRSLADAADGEA